jgi:hypothetical protein
MTGLRKWRNIAKSFILFMVALEVAATIAGLAVFIFVTVRGGASDPDRLISALGTLGLIGVVMWAVRDARGRRRRRLVNGPESLRGS